MRNFIRNYPLSLLFTVFIWVICLIPIPETPLDNVHLIDKWTHIALYFLLSSIIGHEFFMAQKRVGKKPLPRQLLLWEWLLPVVMGGLVEIVPIRLVALLPVLILVGCRVVILAARTDENRQTDHKQSHGQAPQRPHPLHRVDIHRVYISILSLFHYFRASSAD